MSTFKRTNRRIQRVRDGFTLLELLLVMTILVVLAGIGTVAYNRLGTQQKVKAATFEIDVIKKACLAYQIHVGIFPKTLQDLVTLPSGMNQQEWGGPYFEDAEIPVDPWKGEYTYTPNEAQATVSITSNGPDRAKGTADDIPKR